jgi:hypothetical protein
LKNSSEIFGPTLNLIYFIFAFVAAFGAAAADNIGLLLYILLVKGGYGIFASVVIHNWGRNRDVLIESASNTWTVNINGIPVKETTNTLKNLHFRSEGEMKKSYRILAIAKVMLLVVLLVISLQATFAEAYVSEIPISLLVGVPASLFLLFKNIEAISLLNTIGNNRWETNLYKIGDGFYYSAFISKSNDQYESVLGEVFK